MELTSLGDAIERLRSAQTSQDRTERARELVQAARSGCVGAPIDIAVLGQAADVLLHVMEGAADRSDEDEALRQTAYDFIDLARATDVRRAAYPADADQPGGRWLDRIIRLIERSDFTVGRMFRQRASQYPKKTLFVVPQGERVTEYTWGQVAETTRCIACGLLALSPDDPRVAIFTLNRVEGAMVDLACLTNGVFDTMVPVNVVESQLEHILTEAGSRILVVSGPEQIRMAFAARERVATIEHVVTIDPLPSVPGAGVLTLDELMRRGSGVPESTLDVRMARVRSGDLATTMYTSGTTGAPKGITFSHLNLVSKRFARPAALPDIDENEVLVCYLPLYHTFGRYLEMLGAVHLAATYVFAESASTETLIAHMRRFRPTGLVSVPKKWLDIHRLATAASEPPDDAGQVGHALRALVGDRLRWGLSAAGRLDPAVFRFYHRHGVDLLSGYGMTEATGGITMTPPGRYVEDSIGRALPAAELALDDDRQLLLRGPYITSGYTSAEDTAASFRDGWFLTGDIVERDAAGYFKHVDRKKDIYKNASGRTVAPQRIEGLFEDFPEISRVFTVGDGREFVTLLIRVNPGCPDVRFDDMTDAQKHEYFRGLVVSCNRFLAPFERVVNFALIDRDFSVERGELTPKGSFRRSAVEENFRDVIEPMYASAAVDRTVGGLHVKIPFAFLQHLGATDTAAVADEEGLVFRASGRRLPIRRDSRAADRVWIGNACYAGIARDIDLNDWLRLPRLWVGNADLTFVTGEAILLWSLWSDDSASPVRMVDVGPAAAPLDEWQKRLDVPLAAPSLLGVHAAAVALHGATTDEALRAIDYLAHTLAAGRIRYQELAEAHLQQAAKHHEHAVRSRVFAALLEHQAPPAFAPTARRFCESRLDFLDSDACRRIALLGFRAEHWEHWTAATAWLRSGMTAPDARAGIAFVVGLLHGLGRIAELEEDYLLPVRRELTAWRLAPVSTSIHATADEILENLAASIRRHVGARQERALDPDTGREYTWSDVLCFEDGIELEERQRMTGALTTTELIREAVCVLHRKRRIDLPDLAPGSVWISLIGARFGRSIYHVGVRLRSHERTDFMLLVRGTAPIDRFLTDLHLMTVAAGDPDEPGLTPQLGGFWPGFDVATVAHAPGESVEARVRSMVDHPDHDVRRRLKQVWPHLSWSALAAAFEFYRRTEGRWTLTGTLTRDVTVPLEDFDTSTRVLPVAGWRPFEGTLDMLLTLKRGFLDRVRFHFPALSTDTPDTLLVDGAVEALGVPAGLALLKDAVAQTRWQSAATQEVRDLCRTIEACVARVEQEGYVPRSLHFAIQRYREWAAEVPGADLHARASQLRELRTSYDIDAVTRKFPGSRLRLYLETVLGDAPPEGRRIVEQAIRQLGEGASITQVLGRLYADLREKLPSHDQQYFLARAAYPHLDVHEKAELVTTAEIGYDHADLVTVHPDRTGREIRIRPALNSRELDTLHRIFHAGGVGGGITARDRFLIAVDAEGYVVGGIAYIRRTPGHVLLDKIAVVPRCRGHGIGRLLVRDFLRRRKAEGVTIVSARFVRADWLRQFGFQSNPRYPGVVLPLVDGEKQGHD